MSFPVYKEPELAPVVFVILHGANAGRDMFG